MNVKEIKYGILRFVCDFGKDKNHPINPQRIQRDLFPNMDLDLIKDIFEDLKNCSAVSSTQGNTIYLSYKIGLEEFIENKGFDIKERASHIINNHINGTNINTNIGIGENVSQNIQSENISEQLAEIRKLGVDETDLRELEEIIRNKESKSTLTKITSWIGKMTTKAIEKGIEYQVPLIIDKVNDMIK